MPIPDRVPVRSDSRPRRRRGAGPALVVLGALAWTAGCAVNPATGERQLSLVSQSQEVAMGQEYDPQVLAQMGLYGDSAVQRYVRGIGESMALQSERPDLPWTIRVVDDPLVNAFAVPGGFVYITRGILAHINSEAELAGILGHEIGHITARHSVNQISRQQIAQLGLGVGMILRPDLAEFGQLASAGLGLLFLKYGRDAEYQSDDLGVRYMRTVGYNPREMANVMRTLASLTSEGEGGRPPEWASTHPFPENREQRILNSLTGEDLSSLRVNRDSYLQRLDGLLYGANPREGFFRETVFLHPELAFRIDFPRGWRTQNGKTAVLGLSAEQDVMIQLDLATQSTAAQARSAFLSAQGVQAGQSWDRAVNGLPAAWAEFSAATQDGGQLRGMVGFVEHGGRVYRLLGYGTPTGWQARGGVTRTALESFQRVTDRSILDVQPRRLEIVRLPSAMGFAEFQRRYPSTEEAAVVARINGVTPDASLEAGRLMKRVVGQLP